LPESEGSAEWREITFGSAYSLTSGTKYAIVVRAQYSAFWPLYWRRDNTGNYSDGSGYNSTDSGSSWSEDSGTDYLFETYEEGTQDIDEGTLSVSASVSVALLTENVAIDVELSVSASGSISSITEIGYIAGQYEEGTLEISASGLASLSVEIAAVGGQYDEDIKEVNIIASGSLKRQAYVDGSGFPYSRPTDYNRNEAWDEDNEEWTTTASLLAKGAGRLRTQFVVAAGNKIYVETY
jgi:hypothetical protein